MSLSKFDNLLHELLSVPYDSEGFLGIGSQFAEVGQQHRGKELLDQSLPNRFSLRLAKMNKPL